MKRAVFVFHIMLLLSGFLLSAQNLSQVIKNNYLTFSTNNKPSHLQLFFNQPSFFPGDTVFFSTWYLANETQKAVAGRDILNLILIDANDSVVIHEKVLIKNGFGNNQLPIPREINPGVYTLVAYTSWMKNLGQSSFYRCSLFINGEFGFKNPIFSPVFKLYTDQLIEGVENEVVVNTRVPKSGLTIAIRDQESILAKDTTDGLGLVSIRLPASSNRKYFLEMVGQSLPLVELNIGTSKGVTMYVDKNLNKFQVVLAKTPAYDLGKRLFYILHSHQGIIQLNEIKFETDNSLLQFPVPANIPEILVAEIIDESGLRVARMPFFKPKLDQTSATLSLIMSDLSVEPRSKIQVSGKLLSNFQSASGKLNVRVIPKQFLQDSQQRQKQEVVTAFITTPAVITRWLAFNQNEFEIDWAGIISNKLSPKFKRESYLSLAGSIYECDTEKTLPDSTKVMLFFQNRVFGYEVYIKDGAFSVPNLFDVDQADSIFISAKLKGKNFNNPSVTLLKGDSFKYSQTGNRQALYSFGEQRNPEYQAHNYRSKIIESYGYYNADVTISSKKGVEPISTFEDELGQPDYVMAMRDYLVLPTMADVVKELLKSVEYKSTREGDKIRVYITNYNSRKSGDPLFEIDGHLTKDAKHFLALDPSNVLTIKVYRDQNKVMRFGSLTEDGVIIVRTNRPLSKGMSRSISYKGLIPEVNNFPQHQQMVNPGMPDLRSSLYWNPSITSDQDGMFLFSFYTSDAVGEYVIQVNGYTDAGEKFYAEETFSVKHMGVK